MLGYLQKNSYAWIKKLSNAPVTEEGATKIPAFWPFPSRKLFRTSSWFSSKRNFASVEMGCTGSTNAMLPPDDKRPLKMTDGVNSNGELPSRKYLLHNILQIHLPGSHIANFDLKMVSKNCANFVLQFLNFVLHLLRRYHSRTFWQPAPYCEFSFRNGVKKWANFVLNRAAIFKFCAAPLPEISPRTFWELALSPPPPLQIFAPKWCQKIVLILSSNSAAISKFCALHLLVECWGGVWAPETLAPSITNFDFKMISVNWVYWGRNR